MPDRHRDRAARASPAVLDLLLGSRERLAVLRVLTAQNEPIGLRDLVRQAGLRKGKVRGAVEPLAALGLVTRSKSGRGVVLEWNSAHRLAAALRAIFAAEGLLFDEVRERIAGWGRSRAGHTDAEGLILCPVAGSHTCPRFDVVLIAHGTAGRDKWDHSFGGLAAELKATLGVEARLVVLNGSAARARWRRHERSVQRLVSRGIVLVGPAVS